MMDLLYSIDLTIFYFINHTLSTPILDKIFPFITDIKNWHIAYIILLGICFFKGGRIGKIAVLGVLLLITVSDQVSSSLLKHWIGRIRPCEALSDVNLLAVCTGSYSFPSSHAVNNFAAAMFFVKLFPKFKWLLFSVAAIIALSRPYVGVHYPSDIIGGAVIGCVIGYVFAYLALKLNSFIELKKRKVVP